MDKYKKISIGSILFLIFGNISATEFSPNLNYCPPVTTVSRDIGGYNWVSTIPNWSGFFAFPQLAKGHSYVVKHFLRAHWIQSHDTIDSTGFVQCDYLGDYSITIPATHNHPESKVREIIRFEQQNANGAYRPLVGVDTSDTKNSNNYWSCKHITSFPNIACTCYSTNPANCGFKTS